MRAPLAVLEVDLGEGVRAGFTTRAGGNLGFAEADEAEDARINRRFVERWAGGPIAFSTQVHGADIALVSPLGDAVGDLVVHRCSGPSLTSVGRYDGLVAIHGAGIGVLVADCVPVLLADPGAGVVGAVHAGRRGLAGGVVQAGLATMVAHGARPERIRAAIGPAICGKCYEVPPELRTEVAAVMPSTWGTTSWGTPALDLPAGVAAVLAAAGVRHIQRLAICTRTDERFYSYRRAQQVGATTGRFAGLIRATPFVPGVSAADR